MIEFSKLKNGGTFHVPFWEIQPLDNQELKQKYCLMMFQEGPKKSLVFIKDGLDCCHDEVTKTMFYLDGSKMISEKNGLYFFATYVDNSLNTSNIDRKLVEEYFADAASLNNKTKKLIRK